MKMPNQPPGGWDMKPPPPPAPPPAPGHYSPQEMAEAIERLMAPQREAVQRGIDEGRIRREEREAIVRDLRAEADDLESDEPSHELEMVAAHLRDAADRYERGDHLKPAEEGQNG
jgi:hypothetical protein